jgi:alkanesulfonate monooxygenase SsuD/methylene tetrahydromethanopterin reductase-like flavin-dependent oxidoreductase (luciferase family)
MKLSVIDTMSVHETPSIVEAVDELGYHGFWATEHYGPWQSGNPILMATIAASISLRLRIGTAGVLLQYTPPARIAEDFVMLTRLFGPRFEAGVCAATTPEGDDFLEGPMPPGYQRFNARFESLAELMRARAEKRFGKVTVPPLWMCGGGVELARLAGRCGAAFAFHEYLNQQRPQPLDATVVVEAYRRAFVPTKERERPYVAIAGYGACARTAPRAQAHWDGFFAKMHSESRPTFVGTPKRCKSDVEALVERTRADEMIVQLIAPKVAQRIDSYRELARAFGLRASPLD